jgi:hypothetical protein
MKRRQLQIIESMPTTITSENAKCYLFALRKLKILVTGIITIVIVVIVVIISVVVVVTGFGIWFWKLMYRRLHSALFLIRILWLQLP